MKPAVNYEELWESFRSGDREAFAAIYSKYVATLLNYGSKISPDAALVEDCIQDLFIDLWQRREYVSGTTSIKFYLFKSLRNRIYRYQGKKVNQLDSLRDRTTTLSDCSYEEHIIQMEVESLQIKHLREKVDELPGRQREAINLRFYHNFSNEEIASLMGISYASACKAIYAGIDKLIKNVKHKAIILWLAAWFT